MAGWNVSHSVRSLPCGVVYLVLSAPCFPLTREVRAKISIRVGPSILEEYIPGDFEYFITHLIRSTWCQGALLLDIDHHLKVVATSPLQRCVFLLQLACHSVGDALALSKYPTLQQGGSGNPLGIHWWFLPESVISLETVTFNFCSSKLLLLDSILL